MKPYIFKNEELNDILIEWIGELSRFGLWVNRDLSGGGWYYTATDKAGNLLNPQCGEITQETIEGCLKYLRLKGECDSEEEWVTPITTPRHDEVYREGIEALDKDDNL